MVVEAAVAHLPAPRGRVVFNRATRSDKIAKEKASKGSNKGANLAMGAAGLRRARLPRCPTRQSLNPLLLVDSGRR